MSIYPRQIMLCSAAVGPRRAPRSHTLTVYGKWSFVAATFMLLAALQPVAPQGVRNASRPTVRASLRKAPFRDLYKSSVAYRNVDWARTKRLAANSACRRPASKRACGSSTTDQDVLQVAAAPQAFDTRRAYATVGAVVGPVKDQEECGLCVAFAVLAAAQTAAAVGLRRSFAASLSEHDFYWCRTVDQKAERSCGAGWSIQDGMETFVGLHIQHRRDQLPVLESCRSYAPPSPTSSSRSTCQRDCTTTLPELLGGKFEHKQLSSTVELQRHIRQHGSVVCRMRLFSDIKPFFEAKPNGIYKGPGPNATMEAVHAVQVVGYDNEQAAWLIKNSWGRKFAMRGFAWVSFDAPEMCDFQDAYGFSFTPDQPPAALWSQLTPVNGTKGCYRYTAAAGDYPEGVATRFGVDLAQLLDDNLAVIQDPTTLPPGTALLLCGVDKETLAALQRNVSSEVGVLLAIKAVLGPLGTALQDWQRGSSDPCSWRAIKCDANKRVTAIGTLSPSLTVPVMLLTGSLPEAELLQQLPGLTTINLTFTGVSGTLPPSWGNLTGLREVNLFNNNLTGPLPPSWGKLSSLRVLHLYNNKLVGLLPDSWSGMKGLEELQLSINNLTGTLPPSWGRLFKLRVLTLWSNQLAGPLPDSWSGMTAMENLQLNRNNLTGPLPPSWGRLSKMNSLYLQVNQLSGPLPDNWSGMAPLQQMWLNNNTLTGPLPSSWGKLSKLGFLILLSNKLSGPLPDSWSGMTALENLQLGINNLTGPLPSSWGRLSKLVLLSLSGNQLTGPLPDSWSGMAEVGTLGLSNNTLAGTIPASWGSWPRIKFVILFNNPQLRGCAPKAWRDKVNEKRKIIKSFGPNKGFDLITTNTSISGYC